MTLLDSVLTLHKHLGDSPVAVDLKIHQIPPEERRAPTRLLAGLSPEGEELWAVRYLPSGRLVLQLGTAGHRETLHGYGAPMDLSLNYNPATGGVSLVVRGFVGPETLAGAARCAWAQPYVDKSDWRLVLGCEDDGRADLPPRGWQVEWVLRAGAGTWHTVPAGTLAKMTPGELRDLAANDNHSLATERTANRLLARTCELQNPPSHLASSTMKALARAIAEEFEAVRRGLRAAGGGE